VSLVGELFVIQCIGRPLFPCCNRNYGRFKSISFTERYSAFNSHWNVVCDSHNYCNVSSFCVFVWSPCHQKEATGRQHLAAFNYEANP
ncbi:hypothetical protein CMV_030812, partial [Castanea mollissima]